MRKRITQLKTLSVQEWQVLLTSLVLLPLIALALRAKGFNWTRSLLQRQTPAGDNPLVRANISPPQSDSTLQTAQSIARIVSIAANRGPYRANCLKQALATWWLLQRREIPAQLIIGVNNDSGEFRAHAWIEYADNTLIEPKDAGVRYSTFGLR